MVLRSGGDRGLRGAGERLLAGELDAAPGGVAGVHDLEVVPQERDAAPTAGDQAEQQDGAGQDEVRGPQPGAEVGPVVPVAAADVVHVLRELRREGAEQAGAQEEAGDDRQLDVERASLDPGEPAGEHEQRQCRDGHHDRCAHELDAGDRGFVVARVLARRERGVDLLVVDVEHDRRGGHEDQRGAESDGCLLVPTSEGDEQEQGQDQGDGDGQGGGAVEQVVEGVVLQQPTGMHGVLLR